MKKAIFALGFFDGVHLGHQALLEQCRKLAEKVGCQAAAITFDRHPQALFTAQPPPLLNSTADRVALLRKFGMEQVRILPVTEQTMSTEPLDFLEELVAEGGVGFVCGEDFRFGKGGRGNCQMLAEFCKSRQFPCQIVPQQDRGGNRISSTRIRQELVCGHLQAANDLLGHPHVLSGTVVAGRQLGRTIGVPTANLHLPGELACPAFGVYACTAQVEDGRYPAVTNIGTRPTVGGHHVTVEPWLLDFEGDLYGRPITLEFHAFLRPEQKFPSLEALKEQIQKDAAETFRLLK